VGGWAVGCGGWVGLVSSASSGKLLAKCLAPQRGAARAGGLLRGEELEVNPRHIAQRSSVPTLRASETFSKSFCYYHTRVLKHLKPRKTPLYSKYLRTSRELGTM